MVKMTQEEIAQEYTKWSVDKLAEMTGICALCGERVEIDELSANTNGEMVCVDCLG